MEYREYPASADLAMFVRCYWSLWGVARDGVERILPDGRQEIVIHLGERFDRVHSQGVETQPRALFTGQMDEPVLLRPSGKVAVFGVCFHPGGASAFGDWHQTETTGRILALEDVWGADGRRLAETVGNAGSWTARTRVVEGFLRKRLKGRVVDPRIPAAIEMIQRTPARRIPEIASELGWSSRHLERTFLRRVGLTPKTLARITRFQRVLALRDREPGTPWAQIAVDAGYYDQAHLIADFRQFSGSTPEWHTDEWTAMERVFSVARE